MINTIKKIASKYTGLLIRMDDISENMNWIEHQAGMTRNIPECFKSHLGLKQLSKVIFWTSTLISELISGLLCQKLN